MFVKKYFYKFLFVMRIQKIAKFGVLNAKPQYVKSKMFFRGEGCKEVKCNKMSFAQKRAILSKFKNIGVKNYYKAILLQDDEFNRFADFYQNQENKAQLAFQYSKLDKRQDRIYKYLREKSVSPEYALKVTDYDNKQLDRYIKIFSEYNPEYMTDKAVNLEDKKFERLTKLLKEDCGFVSSYDVANLEDDEYERAMALKAKGFNLIFADDVARNIEIFDILNNAIDAKIDMKILNTAFKRTSKFSEIKQGVKKQKPEEILVKIALQNVSESVSEYLDDNIKNAKDTDFIVKNKNGKITTHVIEKRDSKIQCEYSYDKKGKIEKAAYLSSSKKPLELAFSFKDGCLEKLTYIRDKAEFNLDVKSPEFISLFDTKFGVESLVNVLLRLESAQNLLDEDFDALNKLVYGEKSDELISTICDFETKFPKTKLLVDSNMDTKYILRLIDTLKTQPIQEIPKKIFLTSFMPFNTSGEFGHMNKIAILPVSDMEFFDIALCHELQHMKDYVSGLRCGQSRAGNALLYGNKIFSDIDGQILKGKISPMNGKIFFADKNIENLIANKISDYATTDSAEFIAEFGALMRKGVIGAKIENNEIKYSINKTYKDARLNERTINKEEFSTLVKLYLLLGGTPEFNNNFAKLNEIITISQKEALEAKL